MMVDEQWVKEGVPGGNQTQDLHNAGWMHTRRSCTSMVRAFSQHCAMAKAFSQHCAMVGEFSHHCATVGLFSQYCATVGVLANIVQWLEHSANIVQWFEYSANIVQIVGSTHTWNAENLLSNLLTSGCMFL